MPADHLASAVTSTKSGAIHDTGATRHTFREGTKRQLRRASLATPKRKQASARQVALETVRRRRSVETRQRANAGDEIFRLDVRRLLDSDPIVAPRTNAELRHRR